MLQLLGPQAKLYHCKNLGIFKKISALAVRSFTDNNKEYNLSLSLSLMIFPFRIFTLNLFVFAMIAHWCTPLHSGAREFSTAIV